MLQLDGDNGGFSPRTDKNLSFVIVLVDNVHYAFLRSALVLPKPLLRNHSFTALTRFL
ncbi:hypothetical protein EDC90_101320 [Martelella mediterranea]|uniref:Uncharacterized protein n=1 Tax=Martelella mediterranea TaxID=293089 RepID=A0A4R3NU58_9HYPH|nr:hypothetical protein EDC90_101320 [Martelella mediterranea]